MCDVINARDWRICFGFEDLERVVNKDDCFARSSCSESKEDSRLEEVDGVSRTDNSRVRF